MARGPNPGVTMAQVASAITHLGERGGSNLSAIHNVLKQEYGTGAALTAPRLKQMLVKGVQKGKLKMAAGAGGGGRFVLKIPTAALGRRARKSSSATSGRSMSRRRRRRYRRRRYRRRRRRYRGRRRRRSGRRRRYRKRRRSRKTGRMYYRYY